MVDIEWFMAECLLVSGFFILLLTKGMGYTSVKFYHRSAIFLYIISIFSIGYTYSLYDIPVVFDGLLLIDLLGLGVKTCVLLLGLMVVCFVPHYIQGFSLPPLETYFLLAMHTVGMLVTISAISWISLFVGFELMYLPLYAMIGLPKNNRFAQESACKYILLGAFSSGLMLYGISFIYACTGDLSFDGWLMLLSSIATIWSNPGMRATHTTLFTFLGSTLVFVALCFKVGVVPFHFWVRDVYEGSLNYVTALIAGASKLVLLVVWYRIFIDAGEALLPILRQFTIVIGLTSLYGGHFLALSQERINTVFAYSSFGHMGFVLLALALARSDLYISALCYTMVYALTVSGIFLWIGSISVNNRPLVLVEDLRGLALRDPKAACFLAVACFSLLGLPPLAGFMMKVSILRELIMHYTIFLTIAAIIPTMIAAYYYIAIISAMYFYLPDETSTVIVSQSWLQEYCFVMITVVIIILGLFPSFLWSPVVAFFG